MAEENNLTANELYFEKVGSGIKKDKKSFKPKKIEDL